MNYSGTTNARAAYVQNSVTTASPARLLVMLFERLELDVQLSDHLLLIAYQDRPGLVGAYGALLGDADVNIAGMQVSRNERGGEALVALSVDSAVTPATLEEVRTTMGATTVRAVDLTDPA